jgi:hypothetical protein
MVEVNPNKMRQLQAQILTLKNAVSTFQAMGWTIFTSLMNTKLIKKLASCCTYMQHGDLMPEKSSSC